MINLNQGRMFTNLVRNSALRDRRHIEPIGLIIHQSSPPVARMKVNTSGVIKKINASNESMAFHLNRVIAQ
jgi:hypothetical protein